MTIDPESDVFPMRASLAHDDGWSLVRFDRARQPAPEANSSTFDSDFFFWAVDRERNTYVVFRMTGADADAVRIQSYLRRHGVDSSFSHIRGQIAGIRRDRLRLIADQSLRPPVRQEQVAAAGPPHSGPSEMNTYCQGYATVVTWTTDPIAITTTRTTLNVSWGRMGPETGSTMVYVNSSKTCFGKQPDGYLWPANTTWYTDSCTLSKTVTSDSFDTEAVGQYHNSDFASGFFGTTNVFSSAAANVTSYFGFSHSEYWLIEDGAGFLLTGWGNETHFEGCYTGGEGGTCNVDDETIRACGHQEDNYYWDPEQCACVLGASPIIIDLDGKGLQLTSAEAGVNFDLAAIGAPMRVAWTAAGARDAFLALDRNGDGQITDGGELFGNFTPQPPPPGNGDKNGFLALAIYDQASEGGNGDGSITSADRVFTALRLWIDENHDGVSQPRELFTLPQMGVTEISLKYSLSRRRDEFGNIYRYRGQVEVDRNANDIRPSIPRFAVDVLLAYIR